MNYLKKLIIKIIIEELRSMRVNEKTGLPVALAPWEKPFAERVAERILSHLKSKQ